MTEAPKSYKYLRLSQEDDTVDGVLQDESNSISSQRRLLDEYIASHPELGERFQEIVDDGYSGTSFRRPGMMRLLNLVKEGKVDTILVKDLSRFGRNYLDAGYYMELVFPVYRVRLIAVNDCYDSRDREGSAGDINLALYNMKNEMYSRDISTKVKSNYDLERKSGHYVGRVPYGYFGKTKHNDVSVDRDAARIVRRIFSMCVEDGLGTNEIARRLNEDGILPPSAYKAKTKGFRGRIQSFWSGNSVYLILVNRFYTGCFDLYKQHKNAVGSTLRTMVPMRERQMIRNSHEAIITEEQYDAAQERLRRKRTKPPKSRGREYQEPILGGYLKCGSCGCRLFQPHRGDSIYVCRRAGVRADGTCDLVSCDEAGLEKAVYQSLEKVISLATERRQKAVADQKESGAALQTLNRSIRSLEKRKKGFRAQRLELLEQLTNGQMPLQQFQELRVKLLADEERLASELEQSRQELVMAQQRKTNAAPVLQGVSTTPGLDGTLTPELLQTFIRKIVIHPGGEAQIFFQSADVFEKH